MGAGRKTKTLHLKEKGETTCTTNCSVPARNLRKSDLGAVIFVCNHSTFKECHSELLFGLPAPHFAYVKNIRAGLSLFLFNHSDRKLHGIYEAASQGQMNINPYGWTDNHAFNTPYPAQVKIKVRLQCSPLSEGEFKPLIVENYREPNFFWFELDHAQTGRLTSMFSSRPSVPRPLKKATLKTVFPSSKVGQKSNVSGVQVSRNAFALLDDTDNDVEDQEDSGDALGSVESDTSASHPNTEQESDPSSGRKWTSLFKSSTSDTSGSNPNTEQESDPSTEREWTSLFKSSASKRTEKKNKDPRPKVPDVNFHDSSKKWATSTDFSVQIGEKRSYETQDLGWTIENYNAEIQSFEAQNSEWANGNYDARNQSFEAQNLELAIGNYDAENQSFQATNSEWGTGNYEAEWVSSSNVTFQNGENETFEAPKTEWGTAESGSFGAPKAEWGTVEKAYFEAPNTEWGTAEAGWQVPAFDPSSEAPVEGKDNSSAWVGGDVKGGHPSNVTVPVFQPSLEAPPGFNIRKEDNSSAWVGGDVKGGHPSNVTVPVFQPSLEAPPGFNIRKEESAEPLHLETNWEGSHRHPLHNHIEQNLDPSEVAVAVADIPSHSVQALSVKLMEEVQKLKVSHQAISGLQQELVESKADIQLLKAQCHTLESRLLQSMDDKEENMDPSAIRVAYLASPDVQAILFKLMKEVEELKVSNQMINVLKQELVESKAEIGALKLRCHILETKLLPSAEDIEEAMTECWTEAHPVIIKDPVLIVGGFDGSTWLPDLCSYLPSEDCMTCLAPMSVVRKYSSAVTMNGQLYVLGGENGDIWHDSVESYNPISDQWSSCPPLSQSKSSLAGASLFGKIYAIGGGNGEVCFSNTEMLDLNVGRWIPVRSMLQKRFAPAAAELNGAIYVVGGYDGINYLSSAERFDPREHSWTRLRSMGTRRGCHSLTVLNDKLYVLGGYDGAEMVSTTEIFEPRMGSWMIGASMNRPRGYFGAVVLEQKIHVICGITHNDIIHDTVEVYEEGHNWEMTDLEAIGRRSFFSAVAL